MLPVFEFFYITVLFYRIFSSSGMFLVTFFKKTLAGTIVFLGRSKAFVRNVSHRKLFVYVRRHFIGSMELEIGEKLLLGFVGVLSRAGKYVFTIIL